MVTSLAYYLSFAEEQKVKSDLSRVEWNKTEYLSLLAKQFSAACPQFMSPVTLPY